jgi:hypothetical protein
MRSITNHLTLLALLISTTGCMTLRPVESYEPLTDFVKVGDEVEVVELDGHVNRFTVGRLTDEFIAGNDNHGSHVSILLVDIEMVSVEKISGTRTTLVVVGGIVVTIIVLYVVGAFVYAVACVAGGC